MAGIFLNLSSLTLWQQISCTVSHSNSYNAKFQLSHQATIVTSLLCACREGTLCQGPQLLPSLWPQGRGQSCLLLISPHIWLRSDFLVTSNTRDKNAHRKYFTITLQVQTHPGIPHFTFLKAAQSLTSEMLLEIFFFFPSHLCWKTPSLSSLTLRISTLRSSPPPPWCMRRRTTTIRCPWDNHTAVWHQFFPKDWVTWS